MTDNRPPQSSTRRSAFAASLVTVSFCRHTSDTFEQRAVGNTAWAAGAPAVQHPGAHRRHPMFANYPQLQGEAS
jgi:hypothetical protein